MSAPTRLSALQQRILDRMTKKPNATISFSEIELVTRQYYAEKQRSYETRRGISAVKSLLKKPFVEPIAQGDEVVGLRLRL